MNISLQWCKFVIVLMSFLRSESLRGPSLGGLSHLQGGRSYRGALGAWKWPSLPGVVNNVDTNERSYADGREEVVRRYFELWNERSMEEATSLFSANAIYEDTLYPERFEGQSDIKFHLVRVAEALPRSFKFVVDEITPATASAESVAVVGVQWHVEAQEGKKLPFTRGSSIYKIDTYGKICYGFDVPEPTIKSGSFSLAILRQASNFIESPTKVIPAVAWLFYCWFLFISDAAPGPNALQLDPATWEEVRDLSLNFWLVLPLAGSGPVVHPGLEAIFNMVLAWSALFVGFASDGIGQGRKSMVPTLLGAQFGTNAVLLPYLVSRDKYNGSVETESIERGLLDTLAVKVGESKLLPIVLSVVFSSSLGWLWLGRLEYFPSDERFGSLFDLLSNDRLGFSFCVDLVYFSFFQGWLVEDDAARRDWSVVSSARKSELLQAAKIVPFFGLVRYFLYRPSSSRELSDHDS
jgi:hypothetical protein